MDFSDKGLSLSIDGLFIGFYLLNLVILINYLFKKENSLEEYEMRINKLFIIKVAILVLILIVSILSF